MATYDVIIIGGGASGLAAAVSCSKKLSNGGRVCILEKENKLGRKLLATGNGKCNLSNKNMSAEHYNLNSRAFLKKHLKYYNVNKLEEFMFSLGLICKADSCGRIYPYSLQASSVLEVFLSALKFYNVDIKCSENVKTILSKDNYFKIITNGSAFTAKKLILATGGKAQPVLGSSGASFEFANNLNLLCNKVFPSLAPVVCRNKGLEIMKGVRFPAVVSLYADGVLIKSEHGELQINSCNISGICVFQLSRYVNEFFALGTIDGKKYKKISIHTDFMPDYTLDEVKLALFKKKKVCKYMKAENFLTGFVNSRVGLYILKKNNIDLTTESSNLTKEKIENIAKTLKDTVFIPTEKSDFKNAQTTSGGISISEINSNMQSVKYKGLYIIGEALDVDGECGGYNLHWAITSGMAAGNNAADLVR